jgi:hypothetical protein
LWLATEICRGGPLSALSLGGHLAASLQICDRFKPFASQRLVIIHAFPIFCGSYSLVSASTDESASPSSVG